MGESRYKRVHKLGNRLAWDDNLHCQNCHETGEKWTRFDRQLRDEDVNHLLQHGWLIISAGVETSRQDRHETEMVVLMGEPE